MSKWPCAFAIRIILTILIPTLISCERPLFVSHLSPEGIALTKKKGYGMPVHHFLSRIICFDIKCRNKAAWVKEQKKHRFTGFEDHSVPGNNAPEIKAAPHIIRRDTVVAKAKKPVKMIPKVEAIAIRKERTFVLNEVLFEHNSSQLDPASSFQLDSLAELLKSNQNLRLKINGHTDNTGKESRNLKLSRDRAQAVAEYLIQKDIDWHRISFDGFGSAKPIAPNETEEGRRKNRRVEILLLSN